MSAGWTEAEIIRLYDAEGLSLRAVAARTGASFHEVRAVIAGAGLIRAPGRAGTGLLGASEAAALAGTSTAGLRALAAAGQIRRTDRGRGRYRYYRDDMIRLAELAASEEALAEARRMLEALRWAWDGVYRIIEGPDGTLEALRADCLESVRAGTPEELRDKVREDYARMPVLAT